MARAPVPMPSGCRAQVWTPPPRPVRFPEHEHRELELNLILQGEGMLRVAGRSHPLAAGDLAWIDPGVAHRLEHHSRDFRLHIAAFAPVLLRHLGPRGTGLPPVVRLDPAAWRALDVLCASLRDAEAGALHAAAAVHLLLAADRARRAAPRAAPAHPGLARALDLLGRDPGADRARLAAAAGVCPATLSRLVRAGTGRTLLDLRRQARIGRFLALARGRTGTLLAHALAAGYGSYSQCHHDCLRVTGHPPRTAVRLGGGG
jgi:AraC-like DNA-binding protein